MRVIVPYDARDPKTRLAPVLDPEERVAFAAAMCRDTLDGLEAGGYEPEVLATAKPRHEFGVPVSIDDRPLTPAINSVLSGTDEPVGVVVSDLPLLTAESARRVFERDADIVLAPGLGGGTNAIVIRHPEFTVDYHDGSYRSHTALAADVGASTATVDSFRLAVDIDEPGDLTEVLLHGKGQAAQWLRDAGFELVASERGVSASREDS